MRFKENLILLYYFDFLIFLENIIKYREILIFIIPFLTNQNILQHLPCFLIIVSFSFWKKKFNILFSHNFFSTCFNF